MRDNLMDKNDKHHNQKNNHKKEAAVKPAPNKGANSPVSETTIGTPQPQGGHKAKKTY